MSKFFKDTKLLLRSIPSLVISMFILSCVLMNLLANKEIFTGLDWLALDCGLFFSWLSFLCMDVIAKHFGPKASIKISLIAVLINLLVAGIFILVSIVPGNWSQFYDFENNNINVALNATIANNWFVLLGSTIAFVISAIVNSLLNHQIGSKLKNDNFKSFAARSYISTMVAQFIDNLVFALIVSYNFFGWSLIQCITCALTGALVELLCEVIFSPVGYKICKSWKEDNIGKEYLEGYHE